MVSAEDQVRRGLGVIQEAGWRQGKDRLGKGLRSSRLKNIAGFAGEAEVLGSGQLTQILLGLSPRTARESLGPRW